MGTQASQPLKVQSHQEKKASYLKQRVESQQSARSSRSIKQDDNEQFVQKESSFLTSCMAMKCCINEDTTQYEFTMADKKTVPFNKVNVQAKTISLYSHVDTTVSPANLKDRLSYQQNSSTLSKFKEKMRDTGCVKADAISQNNLFNDKNLHIMSQGKLSEAGSPVRPKKVRGTGQHFITDECNLASVKLHKPCFSAIEQSVGDVSPPNYSPKAGTVFEFDDDYELPPDLKKLDNDDNFDSMSQGPNKQHKQMIKLSPKNKKEKLTLPIRNHSGSKKPSIQHSKLFKEMQTEEKRKQIQISKRNLFDDLYIPSKPVDDQFLLELDLPEDIRAYLEKTKDVMKKTRLQNGAIYVGGWLNMLRHGFGFCIFPDKSYYFGEWLNGQSAGDGRLVHKDKTVLSGKWVANKLHGKGFCSKTNGASYEGDWFEHLQHGKGIEKWPDNSHYQGNFIKGLKEGQGVLNVANGGTYKGNFVKNQISGSGTYRWPDGKVYIGEWLESKMHGQGHLKWKDGSREYKGEFKNDLRSGYGEYSWSFGTKSYRGQWKDGKQHGLGFVREEFEYVEKKSLWQAGKLVKWLPDDADSDDDYVLATTNVHAFQNLDNDSCLNSQEQKEWLQSGSDLLSVGNFGDFMRLDGTPEPQSQKILSNFATGNNSPELVQEKPQTQQKQIEFINVLSHIIPANKRMTDHLKVENQEKRIFSDNISNNSKGLAKNKKITFNKKIEPFKLDQKVVIQKQENELFKPKQNNSKLDSDQLNPSSVPQAQVSNRYSSHMRLKQQILSAQLAQGLTPKVQTQPKKLFQQNQEKSNHFTTQSSQALEGSVVDVFLDLSSSDADAQSDQFRIKAGQTAQFKQPNHSNNAARNEEEYFQFDAEQ